MAKVEGREALNRKFKAMPAAVRAEIQKAVPASSDELVGLMQRLAPRDKGPLIASIHEEPKGEFGAFVIAGGTEATKREVREGSGEMTDEAILVEFGTKPHELGGLFAGAQHPGTPPRPFFYPSWRAMRKRIKARLSRSITTGIKKGAR